MAKNTTLRNDPRYVTQEDPRAVLKAWAGPDLTMPMGGWTDGDADAFESAARDDAAHGLGLSTDEAVGFRIVIRNSEAVQAMVDDAIEGILDNDTVNNLGGDIGTWDADFAVRLYAGLEGGDAPETRPTDAQIAEAASDVTEFLCGVRKAIGEALEDDAAELASYGWTGGSADEYALFCMEGYTGQQARKLTRRWGHEVSPLIGAALRSGFDCDVHNPVAEDAECEDENAQF